MNRVGHAFIKRRMREEDAVFGGEVTGPLLFPRQLLRRQRLHPGADDPRADVEEGPVAARPAEAAARALLHLRRDQHQGRQHGHRGDEDRRSWRRATRSGNVYELDGISAEFDDWHFNVRQSNTEPLLRLNLEGLTPEIMEKRRDEVLAIIRSLGLECAELSGSSSAVERSFPSSMSRVRSPSPAPTFALVLAKVAHP